MSIPDRRPPKVFLSYSQTSVEYKERVRRLATWLVGEKGVEVVFDQWDLQPGHDLAAFMERSVGDQTIDYVLILCDPRYTERADRREGGVGTESLVISQEVFADAKQTKFIPVIMQRDEEGIIRVPIYLKGRLFFDLSDPAREISELEELVGYLHGVERGRPALAPRPAYLDAARMELRTGRRLQVLRDAVVSARPHQMVYLQDYLETLSTVVTELTRVPDPAPEYIDDWTVQTIESLRPYRDEFAELMVFLARYDAEERFAGAVHAFFERLLAARVLWRGTHFSEEYETTAIAYVTWEMFLYAVAALLRRERFGQVAMLFDPYHAPAGRGFHDQGIRSFAALEPGFRLLDEARNARLEMRRYSVTAGMVRESATVQGIPFEALQEADVVCWLRSALRPDELTWNYTWWPRLLTDANFETLPLFQRAIRVSTFAGLARALGVRDREEMQEWWAGISDGMLPQIPHFWGGRLRWENLVQLPHLGTRA